MKKYIRTFTTCNKSLTCIIILGIIEMMAELIYISRNISTSIQIVTVIVIGTFALYIAIKNIQNEILRLKFLLFRITTQNWALNIDSIYKDKDGNIAQPYLYYFLVYFNQKEFDKLTSLKVLNDNEIKTINEINSVNRKTKIG